jgi:uncharacterized protein YhaN
MRIAALHLLAYGPFTGRSLEFGSKPGFHLIYGDNEAGKTTTLRALSSVLFGYPHEVMDGYKHDAKDIAVGAELVGSDGKTLSFQRRRRGKNALAHIDGTPLDEGTITKFLGGASREMFETVFALNHHRLHEHARALLSEGGSLGFTLAAAGSGLAGLKATLDRLKAERAALFLSTGSKPTLNQRLAQLLELRKEARRFQVSLPEYKKRQKEIDDVESALTETRNRDRALEAQILKFARIAQNLPLRARHVAALTRLEELASVPLLAADAGQRRIKAESDSDSAETDIAQADEAIAKLNDDASQIVMDQAILDKSAEIEALSQSRGRIEDYEAALPRRDAERAQHYDTARDLLGKAEISGTPKELALLIPSLVKRKQVSALAGSGRELNTRAETTVETVAKADQAVRLAENRLAATEAPADITALNAALRLADGLGDIRADILSRTRTLADKTRTARESIVGLGLEQGDISRLRALVVPSDQTVMRFRQRFSNIETEENALAIAVTALQEQIEGIESRITELAHGVGAATKEDLRAAREERDAIWSVLRGIYIDKKSDLEAQAKALTSDGDIADTFERKTANTDHTADAIIGHSTEAAELSISTRRKGEIETKIAAAATQSTDIHMRRNSLDSEWKALWPVGIAHLLQPPAEMTDWLKRRDSLLREDIEYQTEAAAISGLEAKEQEAQATLLNVLESFTTVESNANLAALRTQARNIVEAATGAATKRAAAVEALTNAQERKQEADAAHSRVNDQVTAWSIKWKTSLRDAGMNEALTVDAATTILEIMTQLDALKPQIDELTHRIDAMSEEKKVYETAIVALAPLVPEYSGMAATEISRRLDTCLKSAKSAEAKLRNIENQRDLCLEARRKAEERLNRSKTALASLCIAAGCEDAGMLAEIEQRAATKQETMRERDAQETRMLEQGSGLSLDALMAECECVDGDSLPGEIAARKDERAELVTTMESRMTERAGLRAAFDGLFGQNQAAEVRQDAANVEADIARLTERYANLALQEVALRQAIDIYRDRNQGPILGRAKLLFAQLTDGAYSGLRADVDDKDEAILIAEHPSRGSLEVKALSDGTVDPLYLALRLAAVQEHNATKEPLPFVADDLLLNLDNKRALATLSTLENLAKDSQVLFFTHHEHIAALARDSLPNASVTEHRL